VHSDLKAANSLSLAYAVTGHAGAFAVNLAGLEELKMLGIQLSP
jgi:hypothetical protein